MCVREFFEKYLVCVEQEVQECRMEFFHSLLSNHLASVDKAYIMQIVIAFQTLLPNS